VDATRPVHKDHVMITYRPVVVEVAQLVSQALHVIGLQLRRVVDHIVVCRCHSALADRLRHHEEVIPVNGTTSLSLLICFTQNRPRQRLKGVKTSDVEFAFFPIRTSFVKFNFYSNFV